MSKLFEPVRLGALQLQNAVVMAPLTRSRATVDGVPQSIARDYYEQRATAGLLIAEGTQPSAMGQGYARTPGIHNAQQAAGWRAVTDAAHGKGAKIVLQIMHVGRIAHPLNRTIPDAPVAPSAIRPAGQMWTDQKQMQDFPEPRALETAEVKALVDEFVAASKLAIEAGFDGVEIHAANGYLHHQFLSSNSNQRTDEYGGSVENRIRFTTETVAAVSAAIGADRTGIRISPGHMFNDIADANPTETHIALLDAIPTADLAYVHLMLPDSFAPQLNNAGDVPTLVQAIRAHTKGNLIAAGGYTKEKAEAALSSGQLQAVVFGRPFIANPDLVARLKNNWPLAEANPDLFYTPGAQGYSDYPAYKP